MKILKNILIALAVIVAIAAVGVYFLPSHYKISNSIEINKPISVVYNQVADYSNWNAWSPWIEMEPDAKITVEGEAQKVGHKMSWVGKKLGVGSITIASEVPDKGLASDLVFEKPMKATSRDYWRFEEVDGKTKATWTSAGDLSYPLGRLFGLSVEKMIGDPERHGLDNLKKICEAMPSEPVAVADSTSAAPVR